MVDLESINVSDSMTYVVDLNLYDLPSGGQCVKTLRIYLRTTTILYGGIILNCISHALII